MSISLPTIFFFFLFFFFYISLHGYLSLSCLPASQPIVSHTHKHLEIFIIRRALYNFPARESLSNQTTDLSVEFPRTLFPSRGIGTHGIYDNLRIVRIIPGFFLTFPLALWPLNYFVGRSRLAKPMPLPLRKPVRYSTYTFVCACVRASWSSLVRYCPPSHMYLLEMRFLHRGTVLYLPECTLLSARWDVYIYLRIHSILLSRLSLVRVYPASRFSFGHSLTHYRYACITCLTPL